MADRSKEYANNSVEVLDAATGHVLHTLIGHTAEVVGIAFSPDGRRIATASFDRTIKLWDTATGREVFTLRGHTAGLLVAGLQPRRPPDRFRRHRLHGPRLGCDSTAGRGPPGAGRALSAETQGARGAGQGDRGRPASREPGPERPVGPGGRRLSESSSSRSQTTSGSGMPHIRVARGSRGRRGRSARLRRPAQEIRQRDLVRLLDDQSRIRPGPVC